MKNVILSIGFWLSFQLLHAQIISQIQAPTNLSAENQSTVDFVTQLPQTLSYQFVRLDSAYFAQQISNHTLSINLPTLESPLTFTKKELEYQGPQTYRYYGEFPQGNGSSSHEFINIEVDQENIYMILVHQNDAYYLLPLGEGNHILIQTNETPGDHECASTSDGEFNYDYDPKFIESDDHDPNKTECERVTYRGCNIRILVAPCGSEPIRNWGSFGRLIIMQINTAMIRSRCPHRAILAGVAYASEIKYTQSYNSIAYIMDRYNMHAGGVIPDRELFRLRSQYQADLIFGICCEGNLEGANGVAPLPAKGIMPQVEITSMVVPSKILGNRFTPAHEFGHMLNGRHPDDFDAPPGLSKDFIQERYYAATILDNQRLPRIMNYSNPQVKVENIKTGESNKFNVCNMNKYGCVAAEFLPNSNCTYYVNAHYDNLCTPTIITVEGKGFVDNDPSCFEPNLNLYQFEYSKDGVNYTVVCPYSTSSTCTFPWVPGPYDAIRMTVNKNLYFTSSFTSLSPECITPSNLSTNVEDNYTVSYNEKTEELSIESKSDNLERNIQYEIYALNGSSIVMKGKTDHKQALNVSVLVSGVYLVKVGKEEHATSFKIVINK